MSSINTGDPPGSLAVPVIPFARFRFHFATPPEARLPAWTGSMWRGALGHALKRTVCVTRIRNCPECLLYRDCAYSYVFETPPAPGSAKMRRYTAAPHPFVLEPERDVAAGRHVLGLTLIGRANHYLPYLVHALARAGREGVGRDRAPFALVEVSQDAGVVADDWRTIHVPGESLDPLPPAMPTPPPPPARALIRFVTPLRVQRDSDLVTPAQFRFADLFGPLLRRVSMLAYFHTDAPFETDFAALMSRAREAWLARADLGWQELTRYSSRQRTEMKMGGVVGEIALAGRDLAPFWPILWLGQWLHAGKATSMGLGRYVIEDAASLPAVRDAQVEATIEAPSDKKTANA